MNFPGTRLIRDASNRNKDFAILIEENNETLFSKNELGRFPTVQEVMQILEGKGYKRKEQI